MENMFDWNSSPFQFRAPVSRPSSYSVLPPMAIPTKSEVALVEGLQQTLIEKSGIKPGAYASLEPELHPRIEAVYDGLMDALVEELRGVDAFDLCIRLYERNEEYLGYIFRAHHDLATQRKLQGSTNSPMQNQWLWERLSPYTESIRWLIEIVLKYCDMQGRTVGVGEFDRLVELARAIYEWDLVWEQIYRNVIHTQLVVDSDFTATPQLTARADRVAMEYRRALMPTMADNEDEEFKRFQSRRNGLTNKVAAENIAETLESMKLDQPLIEERGYSLSDWGRFTLGLLDSFSHDEYRKVWKLTTLESFLSRNWDLDPRRIHDLLRDHALSKEIVHDIDIENLRPVQHGRRDSRLLRRPVVILERQGSTRCLYGVETIHRGSSLVLHRMESGRIDLLRHTNSKEVSRAVGRLQKELGRVFEENIADECKERGYDFGVEKSRVKENRIPQGSGFGPVDVFVVDRAYHRFVLIEAKNVADEGSVPKEMRRERDDFSNYIKKLNLQVDWFSEHLADLKSENGIPGEEDYSVEGVIVVNGPRQWMFTYDHPVPILDYLNFFRRLEQGKNFTIGPLVREQS